ncbi:Iterative polyketide synthase CazM 3 [Colletotrichum plurivorum]|uniref:Iterative polyketide synthase CazM 3 n=1 Tax=Colletotrichum plurivorum TaxID=2175906 RepID=A0A8H6KM35_9PEZI|nr:Iterative polyketide synthase CazM 3 [Colletotrichum plurivorum]
MGPSKKDTDGIFPSLLIFGPQSQPSCNDLIGLRKHLVTNERLFKLTDAVRGLPAFWPRLVSLDPDLAPFPGDSVLRHFNNWVVHDTPLPYRVSELPTTLAFIINFLFQMTQYISLLEPTGEHDPHRPLTGHLEKAGAQGFCVGFLSAVTVATSRSEKELTETAARALRLAVCIGAYVDQNRSQTEPACIAVRGRRHQPDTQARLEEVSYISAVTDVTSFTITSSSNEIAQLKRALSDTGFLTQDLPALGRFHSASYASVVDRLVDFFRGTPDLRFPGPDQLHIPVRSATDGNLIRNGDLVRHILENTLLKPVQWYRTLSSAKAALPSGHNVIALAGISNHFPASLQEKSDVRLFDLRGSSGKTSRTSEGLHTPPDTPPDTPPGNDETGAWLNLETAISGSSKKQTQRSSYEFPPHSVAVVGIAGRFPGANSVDELWEVLSAGRSMAGSVPDRVGLDQLKEDTSKSKWWGNFLDDPDSFDHKFFGKSSREAAICDPQQRKLLEVVYEALESSGNLGPDARADRTDYGCYVGAVMNNYVNNINCHPPSAYATTGTGRAFLSGTVSHFFGWTGPAVTVDTACSSSLVAIHTACRAIASGECSRAVAGGTNIVTSPHDYRDLKAAGFLSPTGQCKPFDADADGYCRGEAVAVVVLKELSAAIEENDHILGVIVGSATSQNRKDGPIVVPNAKSQVDLMRKATGIAGLSPEDVSYVEAHGTGTSIGDPIEASSIREAFGGASRAEPLRFASIKGNIGHAEAASGAAGLIKALLMMQHGQIPPQASYRSRNPAIPDPAPYGMEIPRELTPWSPPKRVVCVNNYGAAGSNSVVILHEPPPSDVNRMDTTREPVPHSRWPLILSAATKDSLSLYAQKLLEWMREAESPKLLDILFNLARPANHSLDTILSTTVSNDDELKSVLSQVAAGDGPVTTKPPPHPVILIFGGQDSRFVGLSKAAYETFDVLRHHLDECHNLSLSMGLEGLYPSVFQRTPAEDLVTLHVALFAVQYACAKAWMDCGLEVTAVIGHSFGQITALCVSGVLSLADTLKLVEGRARLVKEQWGSESGAMLALQADLREVQTILDRYRDQVDYAEIACFNGPRNHVVVGSSASIQRLEELISNYEKLTPSVRYQRLAVTNGFHSKYTATLLPGLAEIANELDWKQSTMHLEVCTETEASQTPSSDLVVEHTRRPVFFQQAVERLCKKYPQATWLEAGRGPSAVQLAKACTRGVEKTMFLAPQLTMSSATDSLVDVTVKLWKEGHSVQFWPFHRSQRWQYRHLSLPPYQFQKTRHWLPYIRAEADKPDASSATEDSAPAEFLALVRGDKSTQAVFRISPSSERFQTLLAGHVMCGNAVMPASAYIEVASRAALFLQEDLQATSWTPKVEDLDMKAPIGLGQEKDQPQITITLAHLNGTAPSWSFSIKVESRAMDGQVESRETTTGLVRLHGRSDSQAAQELRRLDPLVGPRRREEITKSEDAEAMHGKHIYRAFDRVVGYSELFKGIKSIACLGSEAAGTVRYSSDDKAPADQLLADAPMVDSFMQFGGFMANYFNESAPPDCLFVCHHIQRAHFGPAFSPDAREWHVFATIATVDEDNLSADVYVSEARGGKTVFVALGMEFTKISRASVARMISGSSRGSETARVSEVSEVPSASVNRELSAATSPKQDSSTSKRSEVLRIVASIADVPESNLTGGESLADIGIDSLGATELVGDMTSALDITIDLSTLLLFPDINAIVAHVDGQLGIQPGNPNLSASPDQDSGNFPGGPKTATTSTAPPKFQTIFKSVGSALPSITSFRDSFNEVRLTYDDIGREAHALDYWSDIHPGDAWLVMAYVVEAFAKLGCDLQRLGPGGRVPDPTGVLPRHEKLVSQLYRCLEDGGIIELSDVGSFTRTSKALDQTPGEQIFQQFIDKHPLNAPIRHLLHAVGPHLAACLAGERDALQILFGDRANKKRLDDLYRDWPMLVTATRLLGDLLLRAFRESSGRGPFRILEIGGGTGGTTRHLLDLLRASGLPFEYHFTDISASLVQKAKTSFAGMSEMSFGVLDIEQDPPDDFLEAFHVVLSTNCIHATRDIRHSLSNVRKVLREDGAVALIEMTPVRPLYVFDIVVGLLEGWWLFEDGRSHALADVGRWEQAMTGAGFGEVLWSSGESVESNTVRVICGFPKARSQCNVLEAKRGVDTGSADVSVQEVVYKTVGSQDIHADIYCPVKADSSKKMPIALMVHGGSHIIFSRKDIRPPQTRIMLDMGLLPVSLDHRLCPETRLVEGPMVDICDALEWARTELPAIDLINPNIRPDPNNVVVVGWSSGGQLALSTGWTAPERGLKPPNAILAFYCPTDYEDEWWRHPIQPIGAEDCGEVYDVLEAVQDEPITNYGAIGAWEPLSDPRIRSDPRARIVLHINWKAQTLPVVIGGLPSKAQAASDCLCVQDWNSLPQPSVKEIQRCSPLAQVRAGNYTTPTFLVHGTADDLIPWQQSARTMEEMKARNIEAQLVVVPNGPHVCDASHDEKSPGWQAVLEAYRWLGGQIFTER